MKRIFAFVILLAITLTSCGTVSAPSLSDGVLPSAEDIKIGNVSEAGAELADFGVRLFQNSFTEEKNVLISPLSVLCALSMTANGAKDETLSQMESVLGMDVASLNTYVKAYKDALPNSDKYKLSLANSIWFTDDERFTVNEDFLQTNADYYSADIYKAPFDRTTLNDINKWVKDKTDGMIPSILDQIPPDAIMYLVNALAFEAEWQDIYEKHQVRDSVFTKEDGTKQKAEMMYADEYKYLELENGAGFIKNYAGRKYAFAALLPNEGVSVSDLVSSIDGEVLYNTLSNPSSEHVVTGIPKFEFEYGTDLAGVLSDMGMPNAFNPYLSDFSGLGTSTGGNIFISRVLHKTYISVGERGTRAGAATVIEMTDGAAVEPLEPKEVILDRPFVFMLIDTETSLPFFIGTVMDIK